MILLDTDIMIDLLRQYPPAVQWFDQIDEDEEVLLPGYVVMELLQGCRNRRELEQVQHTISPCGIVWPSSEDCDQALEVFSKYHLSHNAGLLDVLIGQTALAIRTPLYTFNQKHYRFLRRLNTIQPYEKTG